MPVGPLAAQRLARGLRPCLRPGIQPPPKRGAHEGTPKEPGFASLAVRSRPGRPPGQEAEEAAVVRLLRRQRAVTVCKAPGNGTVQGLRSVCRALCQIASAEEDGAAPAVCPAIPDPPALTACTRLLRTQPLLLPPSRRARFPVRPLPTLGLGDGPQPNGDGFGKKNLESLCLKRVVSPIGEPLAGWGEPLPGRGRFPRISTAFVARRRRRLATSSRTARDLRAAPNSGIVLQTLRARVAELADAPDLGSGSARSGGSSPLARTSSDLTGPHGSGSTARTH